MSMMDGLYLGNLQRKYSEELRAAYEKALARKVKGENRAQVDCDLASEFADILKHELPRTVVLRETPMMCLVFRLDDLKSSGASARAAIAELRKDGMNRRAAKAAVRSIWNLQGAEVW